MVFSTYKRNEIGNFVKGYLPVQRNINTSVTQGDEIPDIPDIDDDWDIKVDPIQNNEQQGNEAPNREVEMKTFLKNKGEPDTFPSL